MQTLQLFVEQVTEPPEPKEGSNTNLFTELILYILTKILPQIQCVSILNLTL